jgi:hypothetical protein
MKKKPDHIHNWVSDGILVFNQKCGQCGIRRPFTLASQNKTDKLQSYVDRVVAALGHKGALATDESYVSDFLSFIHHEPMRTMLRKKELQKACKKLKIRVHELELIIDVAKRLMENEKKGKNS